MASPTLYTAPAFAWSDFFGTSGANHWTGFTRGFVDAFEIEHFNTVTRDGVHNTPYVARAAATFFWNEPSGTFQMLESYRISGAVHSGNGIVTVSLSAPMASSTYGVAIGFENHGQASPRITHASLRSIGQTTTSFQLVLRRDSGGQSWTAAYLPNNAQFWEPFSVSVACYDAAPPP